MLTIIEMIWIAHGPFANQASFGETMSLSDGSRGNIPAHAVTASSSLIIITLVACRYLGGWIAALFFFFGAPSALLVGYLCDRMNRRNLLFIVVLLGGYG